MKFYIEFTNGIFSCEADSWEQIGGDIFLNVNGRRSCIRGFIYIGEQNPNEFFKPEE